MGDTNIRVRPACGDDRTEILELAPRLAEGVAPWRDQAEALLAGRRWLEESLDAAKTGDGAVLVAADAWARDQGLRNLTLHTGAFNANARGFYAALGFAEEEVRLTRPIRRQAQTER